MDDITRLKIIDFSQRLYTCRSLYDIKRLVNEFETLDSPYIYQSAGQTLLALNEYDNALPFFQKAINYGLKFPNKYWNDQMATGAIGSSISKILTLFTFDDIGEVAQNLYALGYCYLSKCIEQMGENAFESFEERADLVERSPANIKCEIMPTGALYEVYAISDYYKSANGLRTNGYTSEAYDKENLSIELHDWLEDISISGKDADEYTLEEIAKIGDSRHEKLFKALQTDLKNNKYLISSSGLDELFNSLERKL